MNDSKRVPNRNITPPGVHPSWNALPSKSRGGENTEVLRVVADQDKD